MPPVTHQQFADDNLLLGKAVVAEVITFKGILSKYSLASGQEVSPKKYEVFFFFSNSALEKQILQVLQFRRGKFPYKYLGFPLAPGLQSEKLWNPLVSKIEHRLSSWKG